MTHLTESYVKLALQLECRSGSWVARLDDEGDTFPIHIVSTEVEQDVREALDASPLDPLQSFGHAGPWL